MWHWSDTFLYEVLRSGFEHFHTPTLCVFTFLTKQPKNAVHLAPLKDPTSFFDIVFTSLLFHGWECRSGRRLTTPVLDVSEDVLSLLKMLFTILDTRECSPKSRKRFLFAQHLFGDVMSFEGSNHLHLWERNHPWIRRAKCLPFGIAYTWKGTKL